MRRNRLEQSILTFINIENHQRDVLLFLLQNNGDFKINFLKKYLSNNYSDEEYLSTTVDGEIEEEYGKNDLIFTLNQKKILLIEIKNIKTHGDPMLSSQKDSDGDHERFLKYLNEYQENNEIIGLLVTNPNKISHQKLQVYKDFPSFCKKILSWNSVGELIKKYFIDNDNLNSLDIEIKYWSKILYNYIKEKTKMHSAISNEELQALGYRNLIEEKTLSLLSGALFERDGVPNYYPSKFPNFSIISDIEGRFQDRFNRLGLCLRRRNDPNFLATFFGIRFNNEKEVELYSFIESSIKTENENPFKTRIRKNALEVLGKQNDFKDKGYRIINNDSTWQIVVRVKPLNEEKSFTAINDFEEQIELLKNWYDETLDKFLKILRLSEIEV